MTWLERQRWIPGEENGAGLAKWWLSFSPFYLVGAVRLDWFKPLITTKSGL